MKEFDEILQLAASHPEPAVFTAAVLDFAKLRPNSSTRCRSSGERVSITSCKACASGLALSASALGAFFMSVFPIKYSIETPKKSDRRESVSKFGSLRPVSYFAYVERSAPKKSATSFCVSLRGSDFRAFLRLFIISPDLIIREINSHCNKRRKNSTKILDNVKNLHYNRIIKCEESSQRR